jgi:hypothetical protein
MNNNQKKVLIIDLAEKNFETKSFSDLNPYIGGVGMGLKLFQMYEDKDPVIFAIGPLNGMFPYASKTAVITQNDGNLEDSYLGGTLSSRMRFSGIDAIMLYGKSEEKVQLDIREHAVFFKPKDTDPNTLGLPGKKSVLQINKNTTLLDDYFTTKENILGDILYKKNLELMVITATENLKVKNFDKYKAIYQKLLQRQGDMLVKAYRNPSCTGCPLGCRKSKEGEIGGNVLLHSLVACEFAENIYSDIGIVFSCLNVLGYDYTHEDIENLPKLIEGIVR